LDISLKTLCALYIKCCEKNAYDLCKGEIPSVYFYCLNNLMFQLLVQMVKKMEKKSMMGKEGKLAKRLRRLM
jgi:hypothetical protein